MSVIAKLNRMKRLLPSKKIKVAVKEVKDAVLEVKGGVKEYPQNSTEPIS